MKIVAAAESFLKLREGRLWTLLASNDAPFTLAILNGLFLGTERTLLQSVLLDRLSDALDALRGQGHDLPQTAQAYLTYWRAKGWLSRALRPGTSEEEYGLTPEATNAVRLINGLLAPRALATESRLANVMDQVFKLNDETDTNPTSRLEVLQAERQRIDDEIAALGRGEVRTLPDDRALERCREIVAQAKDLADDFHNVRASFERLNQELRARLLETEGSRGSALEALFNGVDYIHNSEAGRTFSAFWRLLTDVEQSSALEDTIEALTSRRFAQALTPEERKFLQNLTTRLAGEAGTVQEVMHVLGASLNRFVRNEDPAKNRRINDVLQQATSAALALKDRMEARTPVGFSVSNAVPHIRSLAQYQLKDPTLAAPAAPIASAEGSGLSLEAIQALISDSEIDLRLLKQNIRTALADAPTVSLAELLTRYPATQGLGTVVGYITLGTKHGHVQPDTQTVAWTGTDTVAREAVLPLIHFTRDKIAAFHD